MPDWIPTYRALVSPRESARRRSEVAFPLVNDELALLWMANMGCIDMNPWYSRVDRPTGPTSCSSTSTRRRRCRGRRRSRWRCSCGSCSTGRARVVPEDVGRQGLPRARAARPALDLRRRALVRGARRRRSCARTRTWRRAVVEGTSPRRADRREPERRGQDDRVGVLGAPAARRARVDAARVGRGRAGARPGGVHDGRGARAGGAAGRPARAGC